MEKRIVVTYNALPEERAMFLEVLGSEHSLTFVENLAAVQRQQALKYASLLLS